MQQLNVRDGTKLVQKPLIAGKGKMSETLACRNSGRLAIMRVEKNRLQT